MATLTAHCTFVDCNSNTAYTPRYGLHPKRAARKKARPAAMQPEENAPAPGGQEQRLLFTRPADLEEPGEDRA